MHHSLLKKQFPAVRGFQAIKLVRGLLPNHTMDSPLKSYMSVEVII